MKPKKLYNINKSSKGKNIEITILGITNTARLEVYMTSYSEDYKKLENGKIFYKSPVTTVNTFMI